MSNTLAVTVLGHDRPGIIATATSALADLGGNLEDSSMTLLRGHFAMTLVVSSDADQPTVRTALVDAFDVTDLTPRLAGTLYVVIAEVEFPAGADVDALGAALATLAGELGVEATVGP